MQKEPYVICGVIDGVLKLLEETWKIPRAPLLQAAGMQGFDFSDYDARAPLNALAIILEEAARITRDDAIVLKLGGMFDQVAAGLINRYVWRNAPTVGQAMDTLLRYSNLIYSFRSHELVRGEDTSFVKWRFTESYGGMLQFPNWIPARGMAVLKLSLGDDWKPVSVSLEHAQPRNLKPYLDLFGPNLTFNACENAVEITNADLDRIMPEADERLWTYLVELAEDVLARQVTDESIVVVVQREIVEHLPRDQANIKQIAQKLGKSPRTLQRELHASGTSFTNILDTIRQELAQKYLLDTDLHISQITFLLGFSEISVFTRAAKRWFGEAPTSYRQTSRNARSRPA